MHCRSAVTLRSTSVKQPQLDVDEFLKDFQQNQPPNGFIINEAHKMVYIPIFKNASTKFKQLFISIKHQHRTLSNVSGYDHLRDIQFYPKINYNVTSFISTVFDETGMKKP